MPGNKDNTGVDESSLGVPAVVGAAIGGVLVIVVVILVALVIFRRRTKRRLAVTELGFLSPFPFQKEQKHNKTYYNNRNARQIVSLHLVHSAA